MNETFDLVIKNALALVHKNSTLTQSLVNIGIRAGKIAEISNTTLEGQEYFDAKGLHVLPGVIDSQVHFRDPGLTHKETFETGTKGAALGGVTSVFDMPNTKPSTSTAELYDEKIKVISPQAFVNFGVFVGATPDNFSKLGALEKMPGCPGVKIFMGSSTGDLLIPDDETLERVLKSGNRRVIVHSEDEMRLAERKELAVAAAHPRFHPEWRDVETAVRSTTRLLRASEKTGRAIHVLHITTAEEMVLLKQAKAKRDGHVTVEVLPQHLTLSAPECYERLGSKAQMNPPIREQRHLEALWKAIEDGTVDVLGSDHAPHTLEEKAKPYPQSPSGMPGVQTLLPLMLNHVNAGRLSLERLVELVCENPRRVFGCRTKGRIEVGLDADFTFVNLTRQERITDSKIASKCGWTPFDGMIVQGWPVGTMIHGKFVMQDGELIGRPLGKIVEFS